MTARPLVLLVLVFVLAPGPGSAGDAPARARPGKDFLSPALRALQDDDMRNPGTLWLEIGAERWAEKSPSNGKSCGDCHGDAAVSMKGVATRYPAIDKEIGTLLNLELKIEQCRTRRQDAPPFGYESEALLALTAYVASQSRGLPMRVAVDGPAKPHFEAGRAFHERRQGQLNLACAQCHVGLAGKRLRGDTIGSGVGTGFPAYRMEWNGLGSLHRRFRACSFAIRAARYEPGSPEYLALELYLAWRARGLPIETPAVRP